MMPTLFRFLVIFSIHTHHSCLPCLQPSKPGSRPLAEPCSINLIFSIVEPEVSTPRRVLLLEQPLMRAVRVAAVRHGLVRIEVLQLFDRVPNADISQQTTLLGDKMNLTVRLGKLFYESSTGVTALLPCSQLPRQARGTLWKLLTKTLLSGSFCHLTNNSLAPTGRGRRW